MAAIDLNADLGEGVTDDAGLLARGESAPTWPAASTPATRRRCARSATRRPRRGVAVGAQVSYATGRTSGGSRSTSIRRAAPTQVADQVGVLDAIARSAGARVAYVKPHGALYNRVVARRGAGRAAVLDGSGDAAGARAARVGAAAPGRGSRARGRAREGFPDRGYTGEGTLVLPRAEPGALIDDAGEIAARAVRLVRAGGVASVCVHGDTPGAVEAAPGCGRPSGAAGFTVRAFAAVSADEVRPVGRDALLVEVAAWSRPSRCTGGGPPPAWPAPDVVLARPHGAVRRGGATSRPSSGRCAAGRPPRSRPAGGRAGRQPVEVPTSYDGAGPRRTSPGSGT